MSKIVIIPADKHQNEFYAVIKALTNSINDLLSTWYNDRDRKTRRLGFICGDTPVTYYCDFLDFLDSMQVSEADQAEIESEFSPIGVYEDAHNTITEFYLNTRLTGKVKNYSTPWYELRNSVFGKPTIATRQRLPEPPDDTERGYLEFLNADDFYIFRPMYNVVSVAGFDEFEGYLKDLVRILEENFADEGRSIVVKTNQFGADWWRALELEYGYSQQKVLNVRKRCAAVTWAIEQGEAMFDAIDRNTVWSLVAQEVAKIKPVAYTPITPDEFAAWTNGGARLRPNWFDLSYLRISPEEAGNIQTDKGYTVNANAFVSLYNQLDEIFTDGTFAEVDRLEIDGYTVKYLNATDFEGDHLIKIGCRRFLWSEVKRFMKTCLR
jgi:hypothetical protein